MVELIFRHGIISLVEGVVLQGKSIDALGQPRSVGQFGELVLSFDARPTG